jgi:hypothetical protein
MAKIAAEIVVRRAGLQRASMSWSFKRNIPLAVSLAAAAGPPEFDKWIVAAFDGNFGKRVAKRGNLR